MPQNLPFIDSSDPLFMSQISQDKILANLPGNIDGIAKYTTFGPWEYIVFLDELT